MSSFHKSMTVWGSCILPSALSLSHTLGAGLSTTGAVSAGPGRSGDGNKGIEV